MACYLFYRTKNYISVLLLLFLVLLMGVQREEACQPDEFRQEPAQLVKTRGHLLVYTLAILK